VAVIHLKLMLMHATKNGFPKSRKAGSEALSLLAGGKILLHRKFCPIPTHTRRVASKNMFVSGAKIVD